MIWQLTTIFVCWKCGYNHEYSELPTDDSCPKCGKATLKRQVIEDMERLVDFDPLKHRS